MRTRIVYPDWVEKYRGKGKEIKRIGNNFYLHAYKTVYCKETKKPKKVSIAYLGKITENGLIPPHRSDLSGIKIEPPLEYGASMVLDNLGKDILDNLMRAFGKTVAEEIFVLGKEHLIEPSPLRRKALIYSNSYDSVIYPNLALSAASLSNFLFKLGEARDSQVSFMKKYIDKGEYIIFDGTRLVAYSDKNALGSIGYNHCGIEGPQVNLLYCFQLKPSEAPVYFRVNGGDKSDYDTIINAINETQINNAVIIADKGFGSESNLQFLKANDLSYIIPLRRNDTKIKYEDINILDASRFDGVIKYSGRTILYKIIENAGLKEVKVPVKKRGRKANSQEYMTEPKHIETDSIVLYYDEELAHKEKKDYLNRIYKNIEGYDLKDFGDKQKRFGTIALTTNLTIDPQKLYETYKERELIEDANKAYKNVLDIGASNLQSDKAYRGWLFINHIALILYYRILNKLKEHDMLKELSVKDVISYLRRITMQKVQDNWIKEEGTKIQLKKLKTLFGEI